MPTDSLSRAQAERLAGSVLGASMLTYRDLAAFLQLDLRTCKRMVADGRLPAPDLRMAQVVRWRRETVERWLAAHAVGGLR